jgi:hypothetical protein
MNVIASKPCASPATEVFISDLYWLAFLLTECEEQSVSIVIDALELVDDFGAISETGIQLQLRQAVIEKSIRAVPNEVSTDAAACLPTASSFLVPEDRNFDWEDVKDALLGLEMFQRRVLLLTTFEGLSRSRAAALLGCDLNSIENAHQSAICAFVRSFCLLQKGEHN